MRLNILWNKISWRGIANHICCVALFLITCCTSALAAGPQTLIETGAMTYSETGFAVDVMVKFDDMSLYNDQVYLSYHIVDENGKEILFENQRIPLNLEAEFITVYVDCVNLAELADRETAIIQFDLIDEGNAYWFSSNANITFQAASVIFDRGLLVSTPAISDSGEESATAPHISTISTVFSIALNGLVWVAVVVSVFMIKRNGYTISRRVQDDTNQGQGTSQGQDESGTGEGKINFLTYLRGLACLLVILSHYIGIFQINNDFQAIFPQILPRSQSGTVLLNNIVLAFESIHINFGTLGVSVFFLITGFLTAKSLDRDNNASFLAKRAVRIYPVYIVGTLILYLTSFAYTRWAGTAMPGTVKDFLIQASLIRDWFWIPSVDQIGWTLEVQVKMYFVYFLLHKLKILQSSKLVMITAGIGASMVAGIWPYADVIANYNSRAYLILYVFMFSIVFLIFGLLGTVFYQYFCGRWTKEEGVVTGSFCAFCFWMSLERSALAGVNLRSYLAGAVLFGAAFLLRDKIQCGRVMSFISTISFSLYITHGLNGYYLLSFLDHYGINPYISLCITTGTALLLAYGLYRLVEKPCAQFLRRQHKKC